MKTFKVSVGIFCHNEEDNISRALTSVLESKTLVAQIKEVVVVSSGSFDRTNRIIREFQKKDKRIQLIDEAERRGKSSAINLFLHAAHGDVLVSMSGDLKLKSDALEEITLPFLNAEVGMVGSHPIPLNIRFSSVGKEAALMWQLHHQISLRHPKCGEMVAFRNVIKKIPIQSAVDEANLEVLLRMVGFSVVYAPRSVVYNKVPINLTELLIQRRRVHSGHLWLAAKYNYTVSTMQQDNLTSVVFEYFNQHPNDIIVLVRLVTIEVAAWLLGWFDYAVLGKNPFKWQMVKR
jgi:cellulose synthase/poly-beta-1,6-N-acetylglucosamine synthase-like glycosyltransferase